MASIAVRYPDLQKLGVEVLAISTDTVFTHKVWQEIELSKMVEGGVPYPMLWDVGAKIGQLYGVYDDQAGINLRGRFIIDPDGVVQAVEVLNAPVGRNVDELIRQIQAFQYVREHAGEACPAGWRPGKPTLKPAPSLAGKVYEVWKVEYAKD